MSLSQGISIEDNDYVVSYEESEITGLGGTTNT